MYLRLILKVIGIEDMTFVSAGGSKVVDLKKNTSEQYLQAFEPAVAAAAQA